MTRPRPIRISDHALVRYLERVVGVSLDIARNEIADLVRDALDARATRVTIAGCIYELDPRARAVITVLPRGGKAPRNPRAIERNNLTERIR